MGLRKYPKLKRSTDKRCVRIRRATRTRGRIRSLQSLDHTLVRLCISRTNQHITAQLIKYAPLEKKSTVLATASSQEKAFKADMSNGSNKSAAEKVGALIAEKALALKIERVAFDRSGYLYHGRVAALADAARAAGLKF